MKGHLPLRMKRLSIVTMLIFLTTSAKTRCISTVSHRAPLQFGQPQKLARVHAADVKLVFVHGSPVDNSYRQGMETPNIGNSNGPTEPT